MKPITVVSPANIAFIKYWGQRDSKQILPYNDSFSMNLSQCVTTVEMVLSDDPKMQQMEIKLWNESAYRKASESQLKSVEVCYQRVRNYLKTTNQFGFHMRSSNRFPMKAGIASSASFFSALTLALVTAFDAQLDTKELSILARLSGSGSACRSIPDGFVWWYAGKDSKSSYAESIAPPDFWDLVDLVLILNTQQKHVGSSEGHQGADSSPYFEARQTALQSTMTNIKEAFLQKDFTRFGTLLEQEAINFSSILMTQQPPLFYWSDKTIMCMKEVLELRRKGIEAYFTIDAGENLHVICQNKDAELLKKHFENMLEVQTVITNEPCAGAHLV